MKWKLIGKQEDIAYWLEYDGLNKLGEKICVDIRVCTNPGGKISLPYLWKKSGLTKTILNKWLSFDVYVEDKNGNCSRKYDPTSYLKIGMHNGKEISCNPCIDFDYMKEASIEHAKNVLNEIEKLFLEANTQRKRVVIEI